VGVPCCAFLDLDPSPASHACAWLWAPQKLSTQLKLKDEMLRQLKAAIKALEAKLTQVMKEHADE
jgi:hypothetical protein